ncbi:MAG: hypothetical protein ACTH6F_08360, partial [Halomonas sp.]
IVLLSETPLDAQAVRTALRGQGISSLMIPSHWFTVNQLPQLGSGKPDIAGAKRLAQEQLTESEQPSLQ